MMGDLNDLKDAIRDMNGFYSMDRWWIINDGYSVRTQIALGFYIYREGIDPDFGPFSWFTHLEVDQYVEDLYGKR